MITGTLKKYIMSRIIQVAGMFYINNNTTSQSIPTGAAWTKYTFPNAVLGFKKHIVIDPVTRDVVIQKKGRYVLALNFSSLAGTNNIILETVVLKNDAEIQSMHIKRQFSGLAVISQATLTGAVDLNKGDVLRVAVRHDSASAVNLTVQYGNLLTFKI